MDVIYGLRTRRDDGMRRMIASMVVRLLLLGAFSVMCLDANVPYRLMRTEKLEPLLDRIPTDFSLANIGLAVMMRRDPAWRHAYVPIHFRERYGGEPSVKLTLFGRKAVQLYLDIRRMLVQKMG